MAMPTAQPSARTMISSCMGFLFLAVCVAIANQPALVNAEHTSSTIEVYFRLNGNGAPWAKAADAGTISVFNNVARDGPDGDSSVIGTSVGEVAIARDGSKHLVFTYALDLPGGNSGSISGQGIVDSVGTGYAAITGGTGDFLGAFGYFYVDVIKPGVLLKSTIHVQFLDNLRRV